LRTEYAFITMRSQQGDLLDLIRQKWAPMVGELNRAGALLLVGTDPVLPGIIPGYSVHEEMALWQEAGIPPAEVLLSLPHIHDDGHGRIMVRSNQGALQANHHDGGTRLDVWAAKQGHSMAQSHVRTWHRTQRDRWARGANRGQDHTRARTQRRKEAAVVA